MMGDRVNELPADEQVADGTDCRPCELGMARPQPVEQLGRPPARMRGPGGAEERRDLIWDPMWQRCRAWLRSRRAGRPLLL